MASIGKRGKTWHVRIRRNGVTEFGTFDTKAEAEAWARSIESSIDRGTYVPLAPAEQTKIAEAIERYREEVCPRLHKGGYKAFAVLDRLKRELGHFSIAQLTSAHVSSYLDRLSKEDYSAQTALHDLGFLNRILKCCQIDWGIPLPRGLPTALVRRPSQPRSRDRRLREGEEEKLLAGAREYGDGQLADMIALALETAMRRTELASIHAEHVDWGKKYVLLPKTKTGEPRRVPLSPRALQTLRDRKRDIGPMWDLLPDSISRAFERVCAAAGIEDLRFHDLRHEATSRLFELGFNMMEVAAFTGHKTLAMLKRYTHLRTEDLAQKLEMKYSVPAKRGRPRKL